MNYNFCYKCGQKTESKKIAGKIRPFCENCNLVLYKNPIPSVAIVAFNSQQEILLTKRGIEPGKGMWCLPGGFVETGELVTETVKRELKEETNLDCTHIRIIGAESVINGFWGDILILGFSVDLRPGQLIAGDDAVEAGFFPLDNRPGIVFPIHEDFMNHYLKSLM